MSNRTFPVIYSKAVEESAAFYGKLGFTEVYRSPSEGEPTFVSLRRLDAEIAISAQRDDNSTEGRLAMEIFVFVDDLDLLLDTLRGTGVPVVSGPARMPWGDRIARVADPDGNPVAVATE